MSARQSTLPDTAALLAVLTQASELCRRLDLPSDAATFDAFIARFQKEPPSYDVLHDEVYHSINGIPALRILSRLKDHSEYRRLTQAFSHVAFPGSREKYEQIEKTKRERQLRKAIRDSDTFWQLEGESDLYGITIPDPPHAGVPATVRLTHSNSYGPFDDVDIYVRVGDPVKPTEQDDLDSATDWIQAHLVEELVTVGDEEMLRSEAQEPFDGETPWDGTYDAQLAIPAGRHSIEVKIVSRHPELLHSMVLSGWDISVN